MKKIIAVLLASAMLATVAVADRIENVTVSLGSDLNGEQRAMMLDRFGVGEDVNIVEVTNREERAYLGNYVDESLLGTRAISCAYVEELDDGSGIEVETSNVTWVDERMVQNALTTAGVKDAKVKVSAPFKVSGTAALTGVIKAFEGATGSTVSEEEKQVANEEIAKTGELGQEIGKEKATDLIEEIKLKVVEEGISDPQEIKVIVEEKARELNITLNEEQFQQIISLMQNIGSLDLDISGIKDQLSDISDKVTTAVENSEEAKGLLQKIADFFKELLSGITS
ncbi:hypothetical protein EUAN_09580 [Andreesenia angusta]|uniref:DUF1002 domain-containing protein n=1 Tax=Andreesenia angusta TaxID=39480 RepID=A0A1S1V7I6_9FIRM|nr:DUF1002 domain-containing protein [Andreesenia angusta]OHW62395.1 hypothetical protein EUAN_09580 [Andreesenia angusta]